jgi:hypothetical protein
MQAGLRTAVSYSTSWVTTSSPSSGSKMAFFTGQFVPPAPTRNWQWNASSMT